MVKAAALSFSRVCGVLCLLNVASPLVAQSVPAADEIVRLKAYAAFSDVHPNYGPDNRNLGVTLGLNLDGYRVISYVDVGLDTRVLASSGNFLNEYLFSGGPRVSYTRFRLRPYGDFLVGVGKGVFHQPPSPTYTSDTSTVTEYGGGLDYGLTRYFSVRGDVQRQRWSFTKDAPYFYPYQFGVGVVYQLHLPSRTGPRN